MIYLDNHASTKCDPRVVSNMMPYLINLSAGNPSSSHQAGISANEAIEDGRRKLSNLVGANPANIIFTSSATEANNLAIIGAALEAKRRGIGNHIVSTKIEHPSVLRSLEYLESQGFEITLAPVDELGRVSPDWILNAISDKTILVSVMSANNEVGTIQPIEEIFKKIPTHVITHTDACQSAGRLPLDLPEMRIDMLTMTAHKMHGAKGVGALCRRNNLTLRPQIIGNHQENGLRAGTQNVPGIVGFGTACEIYTDIWQEEYHYVAKLRNILQRNLVNQLHDVLVNGDISSRLPHNLNISFLGVDSKELIQSLPEICMSSGAACTSSRGLPSHVLRAMKFEVDRSKSSIRIGVSRFNTEEEIDTASNLLIQTIKNLRRVNRNHRSKLLA